MQPPSCSSTAANRMWAAWSCLSDASNLHGWRHRPSSSFSLISKPNFPRFPITSSANSCQKDFDHVILPIALHILVPMLRYAPSLLFTTPSCPSSPLSSLCAQPCPALEPQPDPLQHPKLDVVSRCDLPSAEQRANSFPHSAGAGCARADCSYGCATPSTTERLVSCLPWEEIEPHTTQPSTLQANAGPETPWSQAGQCCSSAGYSRRSGMLFSGQSLSR